MEGEEERVGRGRGGEVTLATELWNYHIDKLYGDNLAKIVSFSRLLFQCIGQGYTVMVSGVLLSVFIIFSFNSCFIMT